MMNLNEINFRNKNLVEEIINSRRDSIIMADGDLQFVYGFGDASSGIVLIGEAPGKDEVKNGEPFVGKAGAILNQILGDSGFRRENLYITNTIKYRLARNGSRPGTLANRPATAFEITVSSKWLYEELKAVNPRLVLSLGNVPYKCLSALFDGISPQKTTVGDVHGSELHINDCDLNAIYVPLYHPASLIYNSSLKEAYMKDMEHVANLVKM